MYPKILYGAGWEDLTNYILVNNEEEEADAVANEYDDLPSLDQPKELTLDELKAVYFELSGKKAAHNIGIEKLKKAILDLEQE